MAWLYKRNDSKVWWIGTRANGRQILKSTGEESEKEARKQLATLEAMEAAQKSGRLNRELFEALTGAHIEAVSLFKALDTWIDETKNANTKAGYKNVAEKLKAALPHDPVLAEITPEQIRLFLDGIRDRNRASTANLALRTTRAFFKRFAGSIRKDPTEGIRSFKADSSEDTTTRGAFTPEQIRQIMAVSSPFWRCAVAISFCTGLRLSNIAKLKAGQLNLKAGRLEVARSIKTGKPVNVALPAPVIDLLRKAIEMPKDSKAFIWPDKAALEVTYLGGQFATILEQAGIREKQKSYGEGIKGRRTVYELSFHSLRHAIITVLASRGVNQQTVKQLVGHSSDRINDAYTHIGQDVIDQAAALLPDITAKPQK